MRIDLEELEAEARNRVALHDFGGDDWREPLRRLLASAREEAGLTPIGWGMVRGLIAAPMVAAAVSFEIVVPKVPALDGVSFVIASSPVVAPPFPAAHLVAPFQAQPWLRSRTVRPFRRSSLRRPGRTRATMSRFRRLFA